MEVSIMGVNVPPFFETDHRSSIHPASFILYSNRVAVPEMIPYWQGDGLIICPVYLLFLPKTVRKFVGMPIRADDGKVLRRTFHIKIQTDQQRIKAAITDNSEFTRVIICKVIIIFINNSFNISKDTNIKWYSVNYFPLFPILNATYSSNRFIIAILL